MTIPKLQRFRGRALKEDKWIDLLAVFVASLWREMVHTGARYVVYVDQEATPDQVGWQLDKPLNMEWI